ncbi:DUF4144 family protein [Shewanella woodyi]|uniref:Uncharacterized protein n=1 Tax=Shewanella woodyi (strain ATCC 51908 / MS32) TaxID=392500 RepID=B1KEQ9_SHEWM|nr:DUF4144 family protein [Shewanella woodyi]ACA88074.1 conserved hypothetical protein [Shewanella woodyi ATCC 51908]
MKKRKNSAEINWPAILIQPQQKELIYLESKSAWLIESQHTIDIEAQLIDSLGKSYQLREDAGRGPVWSEGSQNIRLEKLIEMIKVHASLTGHCCSAKLGAKDFPQAFEIIHYLENEH